jgi:hypothetical protein
MEKATPLVTTRVRSEIGLRFQPGYYSDQLSVGWATRPRSDASPAHDHSLPAGQAARRVVPQGGVADDDVRGSLWSRVADIGFRTRARLELCRDDGEGNGAHHRVAAGRITAHGVRFIATEVSQ